MSYNDAVIGSRPAAYWPLNETSGLVAIDYSGFGNNATKALAGVIRPIVADNIWSQTGASSSDYVYYPLINLLTQGDEHTSGSIEFVFRPGTYAADIVLFQFGTNSGVYFADGNLTFRVTGTYLDGTALDKRVTYLLPKDASYHIVARYSQTAIKLFVNGELVDQENLGNLFLFGTIPAQYSTYANSGTYNISNVALYKYELSDADILNHAKLARRRIPHVEIATQDAGIIFKPSDSNRVKTIAYDVPDLYPWSTIALTDCYVNSSGNLALQSINPAVLNTGTPTFSSTEITLATGQYLTMQNVGQTFGPTSGAIGGLFYFDSAIHNNANAYSLFALSDSSQKNVLHVYKSASSPGNLVLEQQYLDRNGVFQVASVITTTLTGFYDAYNYVYLTFDGAVATLYLASAGTFGQIDFTTTAYPFFESATNLIIGSNPYTLGTNTWGGKVKMFTGYRTIPNIANFGSQQSVVGSFTLKLNSTTGLNVSQFGKANFKVSAGHASAVTESRSVWHPLASNITMKTSTDNVTYVAATNYGSIAGVPLGLNPPTNIWAQLELTTDDSVYDIPEVYDAKIDIFTDSTFYASNSQDLILTVGKYQVGEDKVGTYDNSVYDGLMFDGNGGFYIYTVDQSNKFSFDGISGMVTSSGITLTGSGGYWIIVNDYRADMSALDGSFGFIGPGPSRATKTIEFWVRQQPSWVSTGNYYYFDHITPGSVNYTFYHDVTTQTDIFAGFDSCWVNGKVFNSGDQLNFANGWAHVVLTKTGLTTGLIPLLTDPGRFNFNMVSGSGTKHYGAHSYKYVALYPNIFTITDAQRHYNQFIGVLTARISEIDARTSSDSGAKLYNNSWQIYGSG